MVKESLEVIRKGEVRKRDIDTRLKRADVMPPPDRNKERIPGLQLDLVDRRVSEQRIALQIGIFAVEKLS